MTPCQGPWTRHKGELWTDDRRLQVLSDPDDSNGRRFWIDGAEVTQAEFEHAWGAPIEIVPPLYAVTTPDEPNRSDDR